MITSLAEVLELPNFGHMTKSTIKFVSGDKFFAADAMEKNYHVTTFIFKYLYFKKT